MKINLDELLNLPDNKITLNFDEKISGLDNDKAVNGVITAYVTSYGVKVEGHVETEMIFECDRCLKKYPYHVFIDIDEKFVKDNFTSTANKELELTEADFTEELNDKNEIDITDLIYQSIILNMPSQQLCDIKCPGTEEYQKLNITEKTDPRLEIFRKISNQD